MGMGPYSGPAPFVLMNPQFVAWHAQASAHVSNKAWLELLGDLSMRVVNNPNGYAETYSFASLRLNLRRFPPQMQAVAITIRAVFNQLATPVQIQHQTMISVHPPLQNGSSAETAVMIWLPVSGFGPVPGIQIIAAQVIGPNGLPLIET